MKKPIKIALISASAVLSLVLLAPILAFLVYRGVIPLNNPSRSLYPVRGVDVSTYQGVIDWEALADQRIDFAFIKATEGSSFVDPKFHTNYENAQKTELRIGAYHFFSFDSAGKTQAENFINNVEKIDNMLPPVIDLEFYGDKAKDPPKAEDVKRELDVLIEMLTEHYGMKPIIYATAESYDLYLANDYLDIDIWFRNVITKAKLSDGRKWTFWQFSNRGKLDGYKGKEEFIDLNVFYGSLEEFKAYPEITKEQK